MALVTATSNDRGACRRIVARYKWIDADTAVELVYANARPPQGIATRRDALLDDEVLVLDARRLTTPERTAFDIGRRGSVIATVGRLDALANATGFKVEDVARLANRHPGVRGLRHRASVLPLVDAGAQSPKESQVRMWLIAAGFPPPKTQIPVYGPDGVPFAFIDTAGTNGCSGSSTKASNIISTGFKSPATSAASKRLSDSTESFA